MISILALTFLFTQWERKVAIGIDQYRKNRGLHALEYSVLAAELARSHSLAMAQERTPLGHQGFPERFARAKQMLPISGAGENTAMNSGWESPAERAISTWMKSEKHFKNIVGDYQISGVGIAMNAKGEFYFTQLFLRKRR